MILTRAPGPKSLGQTTPHRYDKRQRAVPPGTGRCQKGAALAVFIPLPTLAVCRQTQYSKQKCDVCVIGFEPTSGVLKRNTYRLDQTVLDHLAALLGNFEPV